MILFNKKFISIRFLLVFSIIIVTNYTTLAQCTNGSSVGSLSFTTNFQTIANIVGSQYYRTFNTTAGYTYEFTYCGGGGSYTGDPYLTITNNSGAVVTANDDYCGLGSYINWVAPATATYRIYIAAYTCVGAPSGVLAYRITPCAISLFSGAGTNAQTVFANNPITNISYATTSATGANFSGLPTGVTGSWLNNQVTISGSTSVLGTHNYSVLLTGGVCSSTSATGTITVNVCTVNNWLGNTSTNWFTASNWSCGVPTALNNVSIPAGRPRYPVIASGNAVANDLLIEPAASLTISNAAILSISSGGVFTNNGSFTNNGTFNQ